MGDKSRIYGRSTNIVALCSRSCALKENKKSKTTILLYDKTYKDEVK